MNADYLEERAAERSRGRAALDLANPLAEPLPVAPAAQVAPSSKVDETVNTAGASGEAQGELLNPWIAEQALDQFAKGRGISTEEALKQAEAHLVVQWNSRRAYANESLRERESTPSRDEMIAELRRKMGLTLFEASAVTEWFRAHNEIK